MAKDDFLPDGFGVINDGELPRPPRDKKKGGSDHPPNVDSGSNSENDGGRESRLSERSSSSDFQPS